MIVQVAGWVVISAVFVAFIWRVVWNVRNDQPPTMEELRARARGYAEDSEDRWVITVDDAGTYWLHRSLGSSLEAIGSFCSEREALNRIIEKEARERQRTIYDTQDEPHG